MSKKTVQISIEGMSCGHCVKTVREALQALEGVEIKQVEIGRAVIDVNEAVENSTISAAIDDTGFVVRSID